MTTELRLARSRMEKWRTYACFVQLTLSACTLILVVLLR
ncbi:hypothetical protein QF034_001130 [Streptomyces africanus]|jgi:hypothetical protein|uniref:Uncharacterized protein n=1 Tax=Streptomyces africanus TaxID=231024 RepID=A0ABU0QHR0_9ACTN|nr:hypothetical protein [Streptomyces africanus]